MSRQIIPLKGRTDLRESGRILAPESCAVRDTQLGFNARISAGMVARALVDR
jgi:hypothetical protein